MPRLDGLRILIVDDDRESCEVMREALCGYGASLRVALSAGAAADALSEFTPDLVLTDIAMPARDGYAVLEDVRALEATLGHRVPVAAVTANAHTENREHAMAEASMTIWLNPSSPQPWHRRSLLLPRCAPVTGDRLWPAPPRPHLALRIGS